MHIAIFVLVTFAGAIVSGLIAWLGSMQPFNPRKFGATALTALVTSTGAVATAVIIPPDTSAEWAILLLAAFFAGAGGDAIRQNATALAKRRK